MLLILCSSFNKELIRSVVLSHTLFFWKTEISWPNAMCSFPLQHGQKCWPIAFLRKFCGFFPSFIPNSNTGLAFFPKEERRPITELTHYFIHRIMSSPSYIQEDLISFAAYIQLKQLKTTNLRCKLSIWQDGALDKTLRKTVISPQSLLTSWPFLHSLSSMVSS